MRYKRIRAQIGIFHFEIVDVAAGKWPSLARGELDRNGFGRNDRFY